VSPFDEVLQEVFLQRLMRAVARFRNTAWVRSGTPLIWILVMARHFGATGAKCKRS